MNRILLLSLALALPIPAAAFELKDGDRVVLIGGTLIEREQRYGYWEAAITARNPARNITFRNLGWSGDSVWGEARAEFGTIADGYKHLVDHVRAEKPTVIVVGYGTNESYAGPDGLPKFKDQLRKLLDDLSTTKARFVLMSPMRIRKMPPPLPDPAKANENLKLYGEAIKAEAERRGAEFIPVYDWLPTEYHEELYFVDGMHPTEFGYHSMDSLFSSRFGGERLEGVLEFDAATGKEKEDRATLKSTGTPLSFKVTRKVVSVPSPAVDGKLLGVLVKIHGLPEGSYELRIDGKTMTTFSKGSKTVLTADEWQRGYCVWDDPDTAQGLKLRQAIMAKNELYFHRWRPQNTTYLFGFRKYEQGQNAREIPQFDPLVEAKEKEIAELKKPREHVYELVRVEEKK
jgi:lysophospholipase L1-like esterase